MIRTFQVHFKSLQPECSCNAANKCNTFNFFDFYMQSENIWLHSKSASFKSKYWINFFLCLIAAKLQKDLYLYSIYLHYFHHSRYSVKLEGLVWNGERSNPDEVIILPSFGVQLTSANFPANSYTLKFAWLQHLQIKVTNIVFEVQLNT